MFSSVHIHGAGFAGLTTALTLSRMRVPFSVYEKNYNSDGGGVITLFPNSLRVLEMIIPKSELEKNAWNVRSVTFMTSSLRKIARRELGNEVRYGSKTLCFRRTALRDLMIRSLKPTESGLLLERERVVNLLSPSKRDLSDVFNVFSDGTHSKNRKIFNPTYEPKYQGLVYYGGFVSLDIDRAQDIKDLLHLNGNDQALIINDFGFLGFSVFSATTEGGSPLLHWYTYITRPHPLSKIDRYVETNSVDVGPVLRSHNNLPVAIKEIIGCTTDLSVSNIYESRIDSNCYCVNNLIIGDAAHTINPLSGQGAGLAIEDGYIFGSLLGHFFKHGCDELLLRKAFSRRAQRVSAIQDKAVLSSRVSRVYLGKIGTQIKALAIFLQISILPNRILNRFFYFDVEAELKRIIVKPCR